MSNLKQVFVKSLLPVVALMSFAHTAHAAVSDEPRGYIGALAGGNRPTEKNADITPTIGVTLGAKLAPSFGIGLLTTYYWQKSEGTLFGLPAGTSTSTLVVAGQGSYFISGLHLGGEIGAAISTWSGHFSTLEASESKTAMVVGPVIGYDLMVMRSLSIGAEAHYLFTTADNGFDNVQVFAVVKLWM